MTNAIESLFSGIHDQRRVEKELTVLGVRFISYNGGGVSQNFKDSELQQLFDLIVEHFGMELDESLGEFYGYWDEKAWGVDPRNKEEE